MKEIVIIGAGYVGLVTATCFAEMGHHVICIESDETKVAQLKRGELPFYEGGLKELLNRNQKAERLAFTPSYYAIANAEVCFIAVGTPSAADGSVDLSYVESAVESVAAHMERELLLIMKSTVPVGTGRAIRERMRRERLPCSYLSIPEFLREGSALADCMKPDRIVIGGEEQETLERGAALYAPFNRNSSRLLFTDILSAEMIKYASNAMLATRISLMNELASLCDATGANINEVRKGISGDKRIGSHFLYAGVGYGGSCFPKDVRALRSLGRERERPTPLLDAVEATNERQKRELGRKICDYFARRDGVKGKVVALWGLAFKPETDDVREASALTLIEQLLEEGAHLRLYDPLAMERARAFLPESAQLTFCATEYEAAKGADAIALLTEWKQFRFVNFEALLPTLRSRALFDGRNQYRREEMERLGFDYIGIGVNRESPYAAALLH